MKKLLVILTLSLTPALANATPEAVHCGPCETSVCQDHIYEDYQCHNPGCILETNSTEIHDIVNNNNDLIVLIISNNSSKFFFITHTLTMADESLISTQRTKYLNERTMLIEPGVNERYIVVNPKYAQILLDNDGYCQILDITEIEANAKGNAYNPTHRAIYKNGEQTAVIKSSQIVLDPSSSMGAYIGWFFGMQFITTHHRVFDVEIFNASQEIKDDFNYGSQIILEKVAVMNEDTE